MLGKSDRQEVPDDDDDDGGGGGGSGDFNHSYLSSTDELRSADSCDHRLLSRKTRLV